MKIIGERINTTRKQIFEAVASRDAAYLKAEAEAQHKAGAHLIDVNAGSRRTSEVDDLLWLIDVIEEAIPQVRFCLDSSDPESLKAVIRRPSLPPMVNSTNGEKTHFKKIAEVIQIRECDVVALCFDDRGIPKNAEQAFENALTLVSALESLCIKRERIYLDPVIQAISTNKTAALIALETIQRIHHELSGVNTICGLSNISFGLPKRSLLNRILLVLAMRAGLTAAIIDPLDKHLMSFLTAAEVLLGQDEWCQNYLSAFRAGILEG